MGVTHGGRKFMYAYRCFRTFCPQKVSNYCLLDNEDSANKECRVYTANVKDQSYSLYYPL